MLTIIQQKQTTKGQVFAACHCVNQWGEDRGYGVWRLCENYRHGRTVKTWRYVEIEMTREAALALLERRTRAKA